MRRAFRGRAGVCPAAIPVCVLPPCPAATGEPPMNRYVAPLSFTLAAVWVVVLFVLVSSTP